MDSVRDRPSTPLALSALEAEIVEYYDRSTPEYYLKGWDANHIHYGIFDSKLNSVYKADPERALEDRAPAIERMTECILAQAPIHPGMTVVDAGCGVGGTALLLAQRGCHVAGVNINEAQIGIAARRASETNLTERARFVRANCSRHLPFEDQSVDVVVNIESACHYEDRSRFLSEVARILKPGGRIVASDWVKAPLLTPEGEIRLSAMGRSWHLAPELESMETYHRALASVGLETTTAATLGDEVWANGWILEWGWKRMRNVPDVLLSADLLERREQARTFADTLLSGVLNIGLYSAVKR